MKSITLALVNLVVFLLVPAACSHASLTMTVLSETYDVWGSLGYNYSPSPPYPTPSRYHIVQTMPPAFGQLTQNYTRGLGSFSSRYVYDAAGEYTLHTEALATRYRSDGKLVFYAEQLSFCPHCTRTDLLGTSGASMTIDFMLDGAETHLDIWAKEDVSANSSAEAILWDLTSGDFWSLFDYLSPYVIPPGDEALASIPIDVSHIYRLELGAHPVEFHSSSMIVEFLNVSMVPVPGAIFLGMIGTSLVGWMRRRGAL